MNDATHRRLAALADAPVNYDVTAVDLAHPPAGWTTDDRRCALPGESPGEPEPQGSFAIASRLIGGYEFADPSMVQAAFDPDAPLLGRTMSLQLRALGLVSVHVGVRIVRVDDELRHEAGGRSTRVFGWAYRTLEGHLEQGQMEWHVVKWLDTGEVEFRVFAVSRIARIPNPVIWLGFHALHGYERRLFLNSTTDRMQRLTQRALSGDSAAEGVRAASSELTARHSDVADPAHAALARRLER